jgi:hypothetical protein
VWSYTVGLVAFQTGMSAFFFGVSRFRLTFTPLLVIFCAWVLCHPGRTRQALKGPRGVIFAVLALIFAGLLLPGLLRVF